MAETVTKKQPNSHMCFVCGLHNPYGLKARFYEIKNSMIVGLFTPQNEHQGYPGRLHGGVASSILDETLGRSVLIEHPESWWVTAELSVRYRKPVPLELPLRATGRITEHRGRIYECSGEILLDDGSAAVTASGKFFMQPLTDITGDDDFHDEMWKIVPESADPLTVELY